MLRIPLLPSSAEGIRSEFRFMTHVEFSFTALASIGMETSVVVAEPSECASTSSDESLAIVPIHEGFIM